MTAFDEYRAFAKDYTDGLKPFSPAYKAAQKRASEAWHARKRNPSLEEEGEIVAESAGIGFGVMLGLAAFTAAACWIGAKIQKNKACG